MVQVVEHLPRKHEALSSNPNTASFPPKPPKGWGTNDLQIYILISRN
jgi:hypothetical protein